MEWGIFKEVKAVLFYIFSVIAVACPISARAATYYVATNGSDSGSGSLSTPWKTIQKAANTVDPNNTVSVASGTYNETVRVSRAGISFQASGVVTMKGFDVTGNNTTVMGFRVDDTPSSGIDVHAENVVIKNNIITRGRNAGMFVAGKNNLIENNDISKIVQPKPHSDGGDANCFSFFGSGHIFRGNTCHDIYSDGVLVTDAHIDAFQTWDWGSMGGIAHDIVFEKNVLIYPHGGTSKGLIMTGGAYDIMVKNNIIYSKTGVSLVGGYNVTFVNNTFVGTGSGSDALHLNDVKVNVNNNIFAHQKQRVIELIGGANTFTASNNCYADYGTMLSANSGDVRTADAKFVNEVTRDYRLQSNSLCAGKGVLESLNTQTPSVTVPTLIPTSSPTKTPTITQAQNNCTSLRLGGDANCDGGVDIDDYALWYKQFYDGEAGEITKSNWQADFTGLGGVPDGKVDIYDYSLWHLRFYEAI